MTTSFDAVLGLFNSSIDGFGKTHVKPKGEAGKRAFNAHLDGVDVDVFSDEEALAAYIQDETGLAVETWSYTVEEGGGDDQADDHCFLVGHLDDDPAKCWGMQVKVTVPHVTEFDASARFTVVEDAGAIHALCAQVHVKALTEATNAINKAVNAFTQGDPQRVQMLFEQVRQSTDGQWLEVLTASHQAGGLERATPSAKGERKRRM